MISSPAVGGILLTGGASRRMGFDKALVEVDGLPNAVRLAKVLGEVASPLVEVGPGCSGLQAVRESPIGAGPLVALCAGAAALRQMGHGGDVLVVACDLPLLSGEALATIAGWPGKASVVPVVKGRPQPLCARWSTADIAVAGRLSSAGERSMKSLLDRVIFTALVEADLPSSLGGDVFVDVDSPMDLERLGFSGPAGNIEGLHRQVGP